MYVALFIIMDVLIFALVLIALYFLFKKVQEKRQEEEKTMEKDLGGFRNDTLHELARQEKDRLAHIEEVAACRSFPNSEQGKECED